LDKNKHSFTQTIQKPRQTVRIERLAHHAPGVAHAEDGKVVFVADAAPGDLLQIVLDVDKGSYYEAHIDQIVEPSPVRVEPVCPLYAHCGGCSWQHIAYESQTLAKRATLVDALERIAHFSAVRAEALVEQCRPSLPLYYRNKLELAAAHDSEKGFLLGLYGRGANPGDKTQRLATPDACLLAHEAIAAAPRALRGALRYAQGSSDLGIYRVGLRHSETTGSLEVALWTEPGAVARFPRDRVAKLVTDALGATSVVRLVASRERMREVRKVEVLAGRGYWAERLAGLRFYTSAPSFFQVNTAQAEVLIELVKGFLSGLAGAGGAAADAAGAAPAAPAPAPPAPAASSLRGLRVADLYAGGGTFSLPLAGAGAEVVAVESVGFSVRDFRRNAELNGLAGEMIGGDSERELPDLGPVDACIVDPPRAGLTKGALGAIVQSACERVISISCNPATWARDVARFEQAGYELQQAVPVDLFPQTPHVEIASLLVHTPAPSSLRPTSLAPLRSYGEADIMK
jgi:23S rRNA (uracil1939-C5)-methyltransferase